MKTFEKYLQALHAAQYTGTDDNMPDDFEKWLDNLDKDEILDLVKIHEECLRQEMYKFQHKYNRTDKRKEAQRHKYHKSKGKVIEGCTKCKSLEGGK